MNVLPFSPPSLILFYLYALGRFSEVLCEDYKGNKRIMEKELFDVPSVIRIRITYNFILLWVITVCMPMYSEVSK